MRSKMVAALSLGILMGMVAWSSLRQPEAQAQVGPEKQQWEYKVVAFVVDNQKNRNVDTHEEDNQLARCRGMGIRRASLCRAASSSHGATDREVRRQRLVQTPQVAIDP